MANADLPVLWLTGASSGIGAELARQLDRRGAHTVVASARRTAALETLACGTDHIVPWPVDVTDREAMLAAVAAIEARFGPIETAVLNAGDYSPMPAAELDVARMRALFDVNYFGVVHAVEALSARMRARGRGRLVINASVAGYRGLPQAIGYGPTKAALIHLAEILRLELTSHGLIIQVLNPGFVKTPLTDSNSFEMPALMTVEAAAARVIEGLASTRFEVSFPRRFTYVLKVLRCLPYALYFPLVRRLTGT